MGSTSKYGRATMNPTAPEAIGICDGCGFLYDLVNLRPQYQYAGEGLINTRLRKCPTCLDIPNPQLKVIILPPDPPPVFDPRPENSDIED